MEAITEAARRLAAAGESPARPGRDPVNRPMIRSWLEAMGEDTLEADVARLSPLKHKHINMLGRYHFELDDLARDGHLRPLRDPESLDTFELTWED